MSGEETEERLKRLREDRNKPSRTWETYSRHKDTSSADSQQPTVTASLFSSSSGSRHSALASVHGQTASSVRHKSSTGSSVSSSNFVGGTTGSGSVSKVSRATEPAHFEAVEFTTSRYDGILDPNKQPRSSTGSVMMSSKGSSEYTPSSGGGDVGKSDSGFLGAERKDGQLSEGRHDRPRGNYGHLGTSDVLSKYGEGGGEGSSAASVMPMPAILVDQPDSLGSQGRVHSKPSMSDDLLSYQGIPNLSDSTQAISMGTNAKLVAGSVKDDASYERPSSFNFNAEEGEVTHSAKLSTGGISVSVITPEGSRTNTGITCNNYNRSSSSPVKMKDEGILFDDGFGVGPHIPAQQGGGASSVTNSLRDNPSTQAVGDEEGEKSHVVLNEGSIDYNKAISSGSSSSEGRHDRLLKQRSLSSQSSNISSRHLMGGRCFVRPADSVGKPIRRGSGLTCEECEEMSRRHEVEMKKKDIDIESLRKEVETLDIKSKLLDEKFDKRSDSYFEEITSLTESLSANQVELGRLRKELVDYEELKCRSVFLEEQAKNAMESVMKPDFFASNIQGTEDENFEAEIRDLRQTLQEKDEVVRKLKESVKTLTTRLTDHTVGGQNSVPPRDQIHPARLQEAELEVEKLRRQVAGDREAAKIAELEDQVEKFRVEAHRYVDKHAVLLANHEELKARTLNAMEQYKTVQGSVVIKEAFIKLLEKERDSLLADATALKDLLSKSDREMAGKEEQLQEAERERTEWEIRAGRLEQFVDETRRAFDNQREELDQQRKDIFRLAGDLEKQIAAKKELEKMCANLNEEKTLHQTTATIFQQDFEQERRDREQAHTKHLEVEERYQHQLNALGQESQKVMDELQRVKAETRKMENDYQVRLSQQSYVAGEVDKKKGELQQRNQELEGELATKMQQLKQYKKQADHLRDELSAHKEVHAHQKEQLEKLVTEKELTEKEANRLRHENRNIQARLSHATATGKVPVMATSAANDQKTIQELRDNVEALSIKNAQLESQLDMKQGFSKAMPSSSQTMPSVSAGVSSSSRDNNRATVLPSRLRMGPMKAQSMEEDLLHRGNNPRGGKPDVGASGLARPGQSRDDFYYNQHLHGNHPNLPQDITASGSRKAMTSFHHPPTNAHMAPPTTRGIAGGLEGLVASSSNTSASSSSSGIRGSSGSRMDTNLGQSGGHQPSHRATAGLLPHPMMGPRPDLSQSLLAMGSGSNNQLHPSSTVSSSNYQNIPATLGNPNMGRSTPYHLKVHPHSSMMSTLPSSPVYSPGSHPIGTSGPASLPGSSLGAPTSGNGANQHSFGSSSPGRARHDAQLRHHHHDNHHFPAKGGGAGQEDIHAGNGERIIVAQDSVEKDSPPSSLNEQQPRSLNMSASLPPSRHNLPPRNEQQQRMHHHAVQSYGRSGVAGGMSGSVYSLAGSAGSSKVGLRSEQQDWVPTPRMGYGNGRGQSAYQLGLGPASLRVGHPQMSTASSGEGHVRRPPQQESDPSSSPRVQESSPDSGQSVPPNALEENIDNEIVAAAGQVVGGSKGGGAASEDAPFDPNLECPTCGMKFRIGQIQNFREHAASCTKTMT